MIRRSQPNSIFPLEIGILYSLIWVSQWLSGLKKKKKKLPTMQETTRQEFNPCVRKIPWRRKWQPTAVCLPGEAHGQRSLAGYSSWSRKESDRTEQPALKI